MIDIPEGRRTWTSPDGRVWPYDEVTSREIDERVERAKEQQMLTLDDLEYYDHICSNTAQTEDEIVDEDDGVPYDLLRNEGSMT